VPSLLFYLPSCRQEHPPFGKKILYSASTLMVKVAIWRKGMRDSGYFSCSLNIREGFDAGK
jgi:hypothetical protein